MRLLLVEDDDALSDALRQGLAAKGFAVDRASDLREARAAIGLYPYDGMILDLGLPDEDGLALLSELRARADPLPILVVTARGGLSERVQGLNTGADDYLAKPFAFTELLARVSVHWCDEAAPTCRARCASPTSSSIPDASRSGVATSRSS